MPTRFFLKGQSLRDSTERFPKNKGHNTKGSTEPSENKGQLELQTCLKLLDPKQRQFKIFRGAPRREKFFFVTPVSTYMRFRFSKPL